MSNVMQWKPEYSVGIEEIDRQHQGLIELINLLSRDEISTGLMARMFDELEAYTKEHFTTEERLLKTAGFDDLKAHRKEHKAFEQWLSAVRQTYGVGVTSPALLAQSVNAFLRDWLVNHILSSDMAYKDHVAANRSTYLGE
ncbi:MAG: hemerythrin family protein [Magnetovibrio sp.]|nr:hemerythrin family protein [Magnetovibrio sp.]